MNLFKTSLPLQMAIATVLGVFFGLFLGDLCSVFASWANAYIMILKITTIPYLIVAIMHGVGQLSGPQIKQILKKGVLFIGLAWIINISMVYLAAFLFPHGKKMGATSYFSPDLPQLNFAELLIPENIFASLANNIIPSVVIFSLLIGMGLMYMKEKQNTMSVLETTVGVLTRITAWVSRITPIGTFLIIANQVGSIHFATIKQVSTYIILYIVAICLVVFWIFPRLIHTLTSISARRWLKELLPILLLAYTTNVVIICLPYIINLVQRETAEVDPKDEKAQSQIQGTVSIIFNLPLGSLFITLFVLFASVFYDTPLNPARHIQLFVTTFLTGLGAIGLGSWINTLTFLLDTLGITLNAINLYLITLPFTAGFQSMVSVMEISTLSLFITLACRKCLSLQWHKLIKGALTIVIPIIALCGVIKVFNPLPKIQNLSKSIYDINLPATVPTTLFLSAKDAANSSTSAKEDPWDRIQRTKTLRVGYYPYSTPFCFYNRQNQLIGYDVVVADELAHSLGCKLEFIPLEFGSIAKELNENLYDIAMSAVSITEERLETISFTNPYIEGRICFVLRNSLRKKHKSFEAIQDSEAIRIIVLKGSSFESLARKLFPDKEVIPIDSYELFASTYKRDVLLWEEQEAISWITQHKKFSLLIPKPSVGVDSLGYAIRPDAERFLNYLNQWLMLKKNEGFTQEQYDLWVLGKTETLSPEEKRWSLIRNKLHWIK